MKPRATLSMAVRLAAALCALGLLGACAGQRVASNSAVFKVTIVNVSDKAGIATVISSGVAVTHSQELRLFEAGLPDKGYGLEGVAEDGHKWPLNSYLKRSKAVYDRVIFDTPAGYDVPENIPGGKYYEFYIAGSSKFPYLSLATMVGYTNDLNFMLDTNGVSGYSLFNPDGSPKSDEELKDVMAHWDVWDAGTEINEPNGAGPNQPDAPTGIDVGPPDVGLVQLYEDVRNPIDDVHKAFAVQVVNKPGGPAGTFQVTVANRTDQPGLTPSALSPILAVAHNPSLSAFEQGYADRGTGLEELAEDGNPAPLAQSAQAHPGYHTHLITGPGGAGPLRPGASHTFEIALDEEHPMLSMMAMYVESNDAFLTFLNPVGECGLWIHGKSDQEIAALVRESLAFMESGTEANQPIGSGSDQAPRQSAPGEGDPDFGTTRRYRKPMDPVVPAEIATISIVRADHVKRTGKIHTSSGPGN